MPETPKASKKPSSFLIRTLSTIALLLVFVGVMWGGHIPSAIVVCIFQVRSRTQAHRPVVALPVARCIAHVCIDSIMYG